VLSNAASYGDPFDVSDPTSATASLFGFLRQRLQEDTCGAESRGDRLTVRFHQRSLAVLDGMRDDLATDPRRADEVVRYLYRMATTYADHPDFHSHWLLFP
jgi:hypothetical protein